MGVQLRHQQAQLLYAKQVEFCENAVSALKQLNSYVSSVAAAMTAPDTSAAVPNVLGTQFGDGTGPVDAFYDLVNQYYLYLPRTLLDECLKLWAECVELSLRCSTSQVANTMQQLFAVQNAVREVIGVGPLSAELSKALGPRGVKA